VQFRLDQTELCILDKNLVGEGEPMRILVMITVLLMSFVSGNTIADQAGVKPVAMLYVAIPLGSTNNQEQPSFGFRLDNIDYSQGSIIQYDRLLEQSALMDFRMGTHGIQGIYFSGTDYLQRYRIYRQNQEQTDNTTATAEPGLKEIFTAAPLGVYIGIGLGVGLLLGVGD
jgi:hypothetical protein